MNMQLMLGISVSCYFISLLLICLYRDKINVKFFNGVFIVANLIFFALWTLAASQRRGGMDDGFMTLENISPYIFTIIGLLPFMGKRTKEHALSAIAFLCFGMFGALFVAPEYDVLFHFKGEANLWHTSEALCHMLCSLFGMYLMITKQVKTDFSHWIKSIVFMWGSVTFGVILNLLYDSTCFNMHPDHYKIYMLDIFRSFEATAVAYYLGILVVLTVGMQTGHLLSRLVDKLHGTDRASGAESNSPAPPIPSLENVQPHDGGYVKTKRKK